MPSPLVSPDTTPRRRAIWASMVSPPTAQQEMESQTWITRRPTGRR